jgi:hypothetical protein
MTMPRHPQLAATAAALALALGATAAAEGPSEGPVKGEVFVVLASEEPGAVDPSLKPIRALQKAPFSSFKSMKGRGGHADHRRPFLSRRQQTASRYRYLWRRRLNLSNGNRDVLEGYGERHFG